MPTGRYAVLGDDGTPSGTESFRCAPGPMGWRYFSEIATDHAEMVDVAVDADRRIARVRIDTGAHDLLLESKDGALVGYRDRRPIEIPYGPSWHLDYLTPATNAITVRRLDGTTEIDVVYLEPATLEPTITRQRYELVGSESVVTPVGTFAADRWVFTSLGDGWSAALWVAQDVVVRYERLFDLTSYEPGASGPRPEAP